MTARSWSFILPYERAPKGLNANDRAHWRTKARSTDQVRQACRLQSLIAEIPDGLTKVRVDVTWVVADRRRRDEDNLAPFLKAIYDGLGADKGVSARIVPDDAPEFMSKPGATIRYEKGATAHFIVTVTEVTS